MRTAIAILLLCVVSAASPPSQDKINNAWSNGPRLAPFQAIRWRDTTPEVRVDNVWYELNAINDIPVEHIVAFCQTVQPTDWHKRFEEDLPAVLTLMGHNPGDKVQLTVTDLQTADIKVLPDVAMTAENRRAIMEARNAAATRPTTQP